MSSKPMFVCDNAHEQKSRKDPGQPFLQKKSQQRKQDYKPFHKRSIDSTNDCLNCHHKMLKHGFHIGPYHHGGTLLPASVVGIVHDSLSAPGAADGEREGMRGRPGKKAFCADEVTAWKFAWEFWRRALKVVFEADGTALVFDFGGLEELRCV